MFLRREVKNQITQGPVRQKEVTMPPQERLQVEFRLGKSGCDSVEPLPDYS